MNRRLFSVIFCVLTAAVLSIPVYSDASDTWIARVSSELDTQSTHRVYEFLNGDALVQLDMASPPSWLTKEALAGDKIRYVYPDYALAHAGVPAHSIAAEDSVTESGHYQDFLSLDGFSARSAPQRWCADIPIAIVDSGVDTTHSRLQQVSFVDPYDAVLDTTTMTDGYGHGTHVAGLIAASQSNVWGGACLSATLMPIRFLGNTGGGRVSDAIEGISWAVTSGARVINHSWTVTNPNTALLDVLTDADERGILQVAAAGNLGENLDSSPMYPASYALDLNHLITVANWDNDQQQLYSYSNYGLESVDIAASGTELLSLAPAGGETIRTGTSMSAPLVSAALAMNWAQHPDEDASLQRARLLASCQLQSTLAANVRCGGRLFAAALQESPAIAVWDMALNADDAPLALEGIGLTQVTRWTFLSWASGEESVLTPESVTEQRALFGQADWPPGEWRLYVDDVQWGRYPYRSTPDTPESLAASVLDTGVMLSWSGGSKATAYIIEVDRNLAGFEEVTRVAAPVNQYFHTMPDGFDVQQDLLRYQVSAELAYVNGGVADNDDDWSGSFTYLQSSASDPLILNADTFVWQAEQFATMPLGSLASIPLVLPDNLLASDVTLEPDSSAEFSLHQGMIQWHPTEVGTHTLSLSYHSNELDSSHRYALEVTDDHEWSLPLWNDDSLAVYASNGDIAALQRLVDGRVRLDLSNIRTDSLVSLDYRSGDRELSNLATSVVGNNLSGTQVIRQGGSGALLRFSPDDVFEGSVTVMFELQTVPRGVKDEDDSRCFIASVLLRHHLDELAALRQFRDQTLLATETGSWLVQQYYRYSPTVADYLEKRPGLSAVLTPVIRWVSGALSWLGLAD